MKKYDHQKIEKKWQKIWEKSGVYEAKDASKKPKYYALVEFPYPSGAGLHVGHPRPYIGMDLIARKRRMQGYNVLFPMGWDAFGLPTENYAIKTGIAPEVATKENIVTFKRQLQMLGLSFDWSREVDTTDPKYFKWTQWMFLQFFKHGLAYKAKAEINWCPKDKIGLANEEVENGKCERCGGPVEKREKEQWMLKMTTYAEKLLEGLKGLDFIPEVTTQQENWIGKSEGAEIRFNVVSAIGVNPKSVTTRTTSTSFITVFTTRPDTIFGATFLVIAPEHPRLQKALDDPKALLKNKDEVQAYIEAARKKTDLERTADNKEKTGVELKGLRVTNPATGEEIPIWTSDYVLAGYGTGIIMAVPAHDERDRAFAKEFGLPIVDKPLVSWDEALKVSGGKKTVKYKLRDWVFSRQRYWGEPIPLIHCETCEWVPVPEKDLPVKLPKLKKYQPTDTGESPLAKVEKWVNVKCPKCLASPDPAKRDKWAKRETDTMPNWAGSSWYFLRYIDPHNDTHFADKEKLAHWLPVDWYNGGMEHATRHLLYARFWNQFLYDIHEVPISEPFKKRTAHGTILASDGKKMSKSLGNVVNPDELVKEFGADALRLYEMFIGPFDQAVAWDPRGILGTSRFLEKVWRIGQQFPTTPYTLQPTPSQPLQRLLHKTIKKVGDDIEKMSFNTAVSAMMTFINELIAEKSLSASGPLPFTKGEWEMFLKILAPFAPHITEELWDQLHPTTLTLNPSVHLQPWPEFNPKLLEEDTFDLIIQVNGKVRGRVVAQRNITEADAKKLALANIGIEKWVSGEVKKVIFVPNRLINLIVDKSG